MEAVNPRITLVGAGPGDPELISLKGVRALHTADAVLYDALVDRSLLDHAPEHAVRIFVGKRAGAHKFKQEEINRMIVAYAFNHGHVVRLKGGDPFVFGRGSEEKDYAGIFNIPVTVVPGISSATAVAAAQSIPLTERGISESFWVLTATTSQGRLSEDIALAVRSTATLVILMGIRKLPEIAAQFIDHGRGNLPVAVVQRGTMDGERFAVGTMQDIVDRVKDGGIGTPGIIIAGDVVARHAAYEPTGSAEVIAHLEPIIHRYGN